MLTFLRESGELAVWSWQAARCNCTFRRDVYWALAWFAIVMFFALAIAPFTARMGGTAQAACVLILGVTYALTFFGLLIRGNRAGPSEEVA